MPNNLTTSGVSVYFTLYSATASAPYNVPGCQGSYTYSDGSTSPFTGFVAENLGTIDPNGAWFAVTVADASYSSNNNVTSVGHWAITFIPRGVANVAPQSPIGNNQSTIAGYGATDQTGRFVLDLSNYKIKNNGTFDWSLMIQMIMSDGSTIKCFASDPEMEVGV
jgi:hypothetical protein